MDKPNTPETLDASFDLVTRQDATDSALTALRGEVDEVKSRLDRFGRQAGRPALGAGAETSPAPPSPELCRAGRGGRGTGPAVRAGRARRAAPDR